MSDKEQSAKAALQAFQNDINESFERNFNENDPKFGGLLIILSYHDMVMGKEELPAKSANLPEFICMVEHRLNDLKSLFNEATCLKNRSENFNGQQLAELAELVKSFLSKIKSDEEDEDTVH